MEVFRINRDEAMKKIILITIEGYDEETGEVNYSKEIVLKSREDIISFLKTQLIDYFEVKE